jgi:hypothetical protein
MPFAASSIMMLEDHRNIQILISIGKAFNKLGLDLFDWLTLSSMLGH